MLNKSTPNCNIPKFQLGPFGGEVTVSNQKRRIPVKKGDDIVICYDGGNLLFTHLAVVETEPETEEKSTETINILSNDNMPQINERFYHKFNISASTLGGNLDDYKYSLLAIKNYDQPKVHFNHAVTALKDFDFETLVKKQVYLSRTTFGYLFRALCVQDQVEVVKILLSESENGNIRELGFIKAIDLLGEFIQDNIIGSGKYLQMAFHLAEGFESIDQFNAENIGFANSLDGEKSERVPIDLLRHQVSRFEELFKIQSQFDIPARLKELNIVNRKIEKRFENHFKDKEWPISIII